MDKPLCRDLYSAWSCLKVWLKQNFFYKKDFDCSYIPIYPTLFCWLLQFLLPNLPLYSYNHILKILCVPASRKSAEFNFFDSNLPEKWIYIRLEFQKTNLRIRISIFERLCARACVFVPMFKQNKYLWLFQTKFP